MKAAIMTCPMAHVKMMFEIGGWCHSVDHVDQVDEVDGKCWDGFVHSAHLVHLVRSPLEQEGRLPFGKRPVCGGM